jgi:hypothetical protein
MSMSRRIVGSLVFLTGLATAGHGAACTCAKTGVADAKRQADVVFAGTVASVRAVDSETRIEPRVVVTFEVARVWKGSVGPTFIMHTNIEHSSCSGFFRELLGFDGPLLVYAYGRPARHWKQRTEGGGANARSFTKRRDDSDEADPGWLEHLADDQIVYTTDICARTAPVLYAVDDFDQLGEWRELAPLAVLPDRALVESLRPRYNEAPAACGSLTNAKIWRVLERPPANAAQLVAMLARPDFEVPSSPTTRYAELWFAAQDGRLAYCRAPQDESVVCGRVDMEFAPVAGKPGAWTMGSGGFGTYCPAQD